jgi:hypothetical protein
MQGGLETVHADGESRKAFARHRTAPERVDHLGATLWAEHSDLPELELPLEQRPFQRHRLRDTVEMQNARLVDVQHPRGGADEAAHADHRLAQRLGERGLAQSSPALVQRLEQAGDVLVARRYPTASRFCAA